MAALTKTLWSNRKSTLRLEGRPARILGISLRAWSTTVRVDAQLAAIGHGDGCPLNRDELGADEVVAQIVELLLRQLIAAQARQENGDAGGVVLDDERREDARREHAHDLLRLGVDLGDGRLDRHIGMEVEPGDGHTPERHRFDVL